MSGAATRDVGVADETGCGDSGTGLVLEDVGFDVVGSVLAPVVGDGELVATWFVRGGSETMIKTATTTTAAIATNVATRRVVDLSD